MLTTEETASIIALRHTLHANPELSLQEAGTKERLMLFLREHTRLTLTDCGAWFYAFCPGSQGSGTPIAFRADMDALPMEESIYLPYGSTIPGVAHKCGHDGHSAALCGLALLLDRCPPPQDTYLVFQHAEEIGAGGEACSTLLQEKGIRQVFACHNWSGYPKGTVVLCSGTAMFASEGLTVDFTGIPAHASRPEDGVNPARAIAELTLKLLDRAGTPDPETGALGTIVQLEAGSKNFGMSASSGSLSCTLRAKTTALLTTLRDQVLEDAAALAAQYGLVMSHTEQDVFPAVVCHDAACHAVERAANTLGYPVQYLNEGIRTSEDFGWYTATIPGAMFFYGNGKDYPQIHTREYDFPDDSLKEIACLFYTICHQAIIV